MKTALVGIFVIGCLAANAAYAAGKPRKITAAEEAAVKEAVASELKDPESAQFRNFFMREGDGTVCGEVNAKNSYGGYVGYSHFLGLVLSGGKKPGAVVVRMDSSNENMAYALCRQKGLVAK